MSQAVPIPVFTLFGETAPFPDIVHVERIADRAPAHGWTIAAHRHGRLAQILAIESGAAEAWIDRQVLALHDGDILFVPPHAVHGYRFRPGTLGRVISLPSEVVQSVAPVSAEISALLSLPHHLHGARGVAQRIMLLVEAVAGTGPFRTQQVLALTHAVLAAVAAEGARHAPQARGAADDRLMQLDALIAAHLSEGWQVSDYARALTLSTGHLSRICRAATGLGAKAYVEQAVIAEACRLLAFTDLSVAGIGYRLGYDDPSHFSKRFRAARGMAPSDYRQQLETRATAEG
jgi:AraC family transcriptional activator of pobA